MNRVIIRWLMKNSPHSLDIVMSESEAKEHIRKYVEQKGVFLTGYDFEQDRNWCIDSSEVAAVLTLSIERLQEDEKRRQQAMQQVKQPDNKLTATPPFGGKGGWGIS